MTKSKYVIEISKSFSRIGSTSSKGNQPKYFYNNKWYKTDCLGYEGLTEVICSRLAEAVNFPYFAVKYRLCTLVTFYGDKTGCESDNFINENQNEYSLPRLIRKIYGTDTDEFLNNNMSCTEKIQIICDKISAVPGLSDFGNYLTAVLEFDRLVLNEDRHFHNILFLYDETADRFSCAPLFDNGAAFMSDTSIDYPLSEKITVCRKKIKAKPFSTDFDRQVKSAQQIYGKQLFPPEKIHIETEDLYDYYDKQCVERCMNILRVQLNRYYPESELIINS